MSLWRVAGCDGQRQGSWQSVSEIAPNAMICFDFRRRTPSRFAAFLVAVVVVNCLASRQDYVPVCLLMVADLTNLALHGPAQSGDRSRPAPPREHGGSKSLGRLDECGGHGLTSVGRAVNRGKMRRRHVRPLLHSRSRGQLPHADATSSEPSG